MIAALQSDGVSFLTAFTQKPNSRPMRKSCVRSDGSMSKEKIDREGRFFLLYKDYEKDIFAVCDKDSNSNGKTVLDDASLVY